MKTILQGKISTFGGPKDTSIRADEGLALVDSSNFESLKKYFLREQPPGTTGLARRLDPEHYYIACRWEYATTPKHYLNKILVEVRNPENGRSAQAKPLDWGPAVWTGRVADLSPGLAKFLELETDDTCSVEIPHPGSEVTHSRRPATEEFVGRGHRTVLSEAEVKTAFGAFNYRESSPKGAIIILPTWPQDNLTEILIPQVKGLPHYGGKSGFSGKLVCHKENRTTTTGSICCN